MAEEQLSKTEHFKLKKLAEIIHCDRRLRKERAPIWKSKKEAREGESFDFF